MPASNHPVPIRGIFEDNCLVANTLGPANTADKLMTPKQWDGLRSRLQGQGASHPGNLPWQILLGPVPATCS